jgi:hypothetical protein
LQEPARLTGVVADPARTPDRLTGIWEHAVVPAPHLVAECPQTCQPPTEDRPFHDDSPRPGVGVGNRPRGLDDRTTLGYVDLEGGVVERERATPFQARLDRLVDAAVEAYET